MICTVLSATLVISPVSSQSKFTANCLDGRSLITKVKAGDPRDHKLINRTPTGKFRCLTIIPKNYHENYMQNGCIFSYAADNSAYTIHDVYDSRPFSIGCVRLPKLNQYQFTTSTVITIS